MTFRSTGATAGRPVWLPALAMATLLLAGCTGDRIDLPEAATSLGAATSPGAAAGYNVLLVTIDTARRDRFGCYGDADAQTPCVDDLAAGGVRFSDAITSVPLTLPSHATLMTGLYPPRHGVHDNGIDALGPGPATLAEVLAANGYATGAFVGCFVLDERFGLDRGFDTYDFAVDDAGYHAQMTDFNERSAGAVTDAALGWLERHAGAPDPAPFFVWTHFFDPHRPYSSPLAGRPALANRPYDAEIAYVDQQLQRIVDWLDARRLRDRTLIVVTSDHGESLGEHGEETHGMFVYDATLRVPLVMSCPSLFRGPGRRDDRAVGLVDLRPTIQGLLGIATDDTMDGHSLLGDLPADRQLYIETAGPVRMARCAMLRGLRSHASKYISAPEPEYYDLAADPAEEHNRYPERAGSLDALQEELAARAEAPPRSRESRQVSEAESERLRSLGYTMSGASDDNDTLPDPKWLIDEFHDGMRAEQLYAEGRYAEAAELARKTLRECDGCVNAVRVLAFSELRMGHPDAAIATLQAAVDREPDRYLVRSLAQAMIVDGQRDEAREVLDLYGRIAPQDGWVPLLRGDCAAAESRYEKALEYYERARKLDVWGAGRRAAERIAKVRLLLEEVAKGR
ncbi:sulfatase-like hydrolase/transferase [bacterium]|nr:sulfatase-like hydrolase/transferase [bacterium]